MSIARRRFLQTAAAVATLSTSQLLLAQRIKTRDLPMPQKTLGSTGVKIPILQLGTSQRLDPTYDKVMHRCFKEGVTVFDTALSYGWGASHRAIANFIDQMGNRKQLWLTSKSHGSSPQQFIQDIDKALAELQTDYLDLYFMHGIRNADKLSNDYLRAGERLKKTGKTRFFGFSCHDGNVVELMNLAAKTGGIDAILFRYNFRRYGDRELNLAIDACKQAGIGLIAMKTMGSIPADIENVMQYQSKNFTLAQAKLKSVWADERIDSLVSEMDSVQVARENIAAAKTEQTLTAQEMQQLNRLAALTANYSCNGCSHLCESAIKGQTAIADQLRYLMYYECHKKPERARELYQGLAAAQQDFDEQELQTAMRACPQKIDIAARLRKAREILS